MPFRLRGTGASDCQKEATKVRRFGQERSAHRSPVASLIILAGLIATSAFASAAPAGWDDLAGPLRALTSAGSALQQVEVTFRSPQDARARTCLLWVQSLNTGATAGPSAWCLRVTFWIWRRSHRWLKSVSRRAPSPVRVSAPW